MSRFRARLRGFFQDMWSHLPDGNLEQSTEKVKLSVFLSQRKCVLCNTEEIPFTFLVLCLALNLVLSKIALLLMLSGTCERLTCFKEKILERINIHCCLCCLPKNTWPQGLQKSLGLAVWPCLSSTG